MKTALKAMVLLILVYLVLSPSFLSAHGDKRPMKKGILLVAFGTTVTEAQISFENIERSTKQTFPGIPIRWGYTSEDEDFPGVEYTRKYKFSTLKEKKAFLQGIEEAGILMEYNEIEGDLAYEVLPG